MSNYEDHPDYGKCVCCGYWAHGFSEKAEGCKDCNWQGNGYKDNWRPIPEAPEPKCGNCGGKGVVDSGGQNQDGSWIDIPCPECHPEPTKAGNTSERRRIAAMLMSGMVDDCQSGSSGRIDAHLDSIADISVRGADALLARLDKEGE